MPSLREVVAQWLDDKLILQQFTHENCPPEKDVTTCPRDSAGKHRPCIECHIEYVLEETDSLLALLSQHGVVQLDENQELPELPDRWHESEGEGWAELISEGSAKAVIDTLLKANFKRVCPLVEES